MRPFWILKRSVGTSISASRAILPLILDLPAKAASLLVHRLLLHQKCSQLAVLGFEVARGILEAFFGKHEKAVEFVIGQLHLGDTAFIGRLHACVTLVLGRDDLLLEDHDDRGVGDPAQHDERNERDRHLEGRTEFEELDRAAAAQVKLPVRKHPVQE